MKNKGYVFFFFMFLTSTTTIFPMDFLKKIPFIRLFFRSEKLEPQQYQPNIVTRTEDLESSWIQLDDEINGKEEDFSGMPQLVEPSFPSLYPRVEVKDENGESCYYQIEVPLKRQRSLKIEEQPEDQDEDNSSLDRQNPNLTSLSAKSTSQHKTLSNYTDEDDSSESEEDNMSFHHRSPWNKHERNQQRLRNQRMRARRKH